MDLQDLKSQQYNLNARCCPCPEHERSHGELQNLKTSSLNMFQEHGQRKGSIYKAGFSVPLLAEKVFVRNHLNFCLNLICCFFFLSYSQRNCQIEVVAKVQHMAGKHFGQVRIFLTLLWQAKADFGT